MFEFDEIEGILMYSIEDKKIDFEKLINLNEKTSDILDEVYEDMLNSKTQFVLSLFEFQWYDALESISDSTEAYDESVEDINITHKLFNEFKETHITERCQLEEILFMLSISTILLDEAKEENDLVCLWESIYQIERRMKHYKLI